MRCPCPARRDRHRQAATRGAPRAVCSNDIKQNESHCMAVPGAAPSCPDPPHPSTPGRVHHGHPRSAAIDCSRLSLVSSPSPQNSFKIRFSEVDDWQCFESRRQMKCCVLLGSQVRAVRSAQLSYEPAPLFTLLLQFSVRVKAGLAKARATTKKWGCKGGGLKSAFQLAAFPSFTQT